MKRFAFLMLIVIIPMLSFAQEAKPLEFSEVVQVDGATKDELYSRAKLFFANAFKDAKEVIQMDDKNAGVIVGKGITTNRYSRKGLLATGYANTINFTFSIALKDGRYKYDIDNIYLYTTDVNLRKMEFGLINTSDTPSVYPYSWSKKIQTEFYLSAKKHTEETCQGLIETLKSAMQTPIGGSGDDW